MKYYTYVYFDGKIPFYVGKGSNDRSNDHIRKIKSGASFSNKGFESKLKTLIEENKLPRIERFYCEDEEKAFELEEFLITEIGRINLETGPLYNLTDGGLGVKKYILSEEHKASIKKSNSEREISEATMNNFAGWNKGIPQTDETKAKISAGVKGKKRSPEQIENYRRAAQNRSKEHCEKISKAHQAKKLLQTA